MIVHHAGIAITVHGFHVRQRCSWCGAVLIDEDLTRVAVQLNEDGSVPPFPTWETDKLVAVDEWLEAHYFDGEPQAVMIDHRPADDDDEGGPGSYGGPWIVQVFCDL